MDGMMDKRAGPVNWSARLADYDSDSDPQARPTYEATAPWAAP